MQIVANRRNALKSTGPQTTAGKRRSRRNAFRHGLTAITIVDTLESAADFEKVESKINADYSPYTAVECALVARLASLLWRLRRATSIESGLLQNHAVDLNDSSALSSGQDVSEFAELNGIYDFVSLLEKRATIGGAKYNCRDGTDASRNAPHIVDHTKLDLARSFQQVSNLNGCAFEKLARYERSLWRQALQIILFLNSHTQGYNRRPRGRKQKNSATQSRPFFPAHFFERP
ncbi:MAG TPA: hypothetical protein VFC54_05590 [Pseudolabrys sp.]|nr:hypothetical protein [Pseudolabrys sp.]